MAGANARGVGAWRACGVGAGTGQWGCVGGSWSVACLHSGGGVCARDGLLEAWRERERGSGVAEGDELLERLSVSRGTCFFLLPEYLRTAVKTRIVCAHAKTALRKLCMASAKVSCHVNFLSCVSTMAKSL